MTDEVNRPWDHWDHEDWLFFHDAAKEIERELGVSPGKAQSILRQLCASGEVRSHKEPYMIENDGEPTGQAPPELIEPREWRDREIDLMTDDDGCNYFVDVNNTDFRYWLSKQSTEAKKQEPKKEAVGKQPRVKALLAEMFPNGVPDPGLCPRQTLKADLLKRDPSLSPLDETTLKSAIDAYNLNIAS